MTYKKFCLTFPNNYNRNNSTKQLYSIYNLTHNSWNSLANARALTPAPKITINNFISKEIPIIEWLDLRSKRDRR